MPFSRVFKHTYLAQEVPWSIRWSSQVEACPLHFGRADPCDHPKCGWLGCVIFAYGGLRSRYPLLLIKLIFFKEGKTENCTISFAPLYYWKKHIPTPHYIHTYTVYRPLAGLSLIIQWPMTRLEQMWIIISFVGLVKSLLLHANEAAKQW